MCEDHVERVRTVPTRNAILILTRAVTRPFIFSISKLRANPCVPRTRSTLAGTLKRKTATPTITNVIGAHERFPLRRILYFLSHGEFPPAEGNRHW
jgi:hypothetical protein